MAAGSLNGKIALITGSTSGIGKATALLFAREGATVVVSGIKDDDGKNVVAKITEHGGKAIYIHCDVTKEDDVRNAIEQTIATFGKLDIAFNNAGVEQAPSAPLTETSVEQVKQIFETNVLGVWLCMKYEIPAMQKSGGAIINTSSIAGHVGMSGVSVYVASKHAVEGLTKTVALEVAAKGIRVNAVAPAGINTDMITRFAGDSNLEVREHLKGIHPVGRIGEPEEVANAVLFLASPQASFITGISLPVDGGYLAKSGIAPL